MATVAHEILITLLRSNPEWLAALLKLTSRTVLREVLEPVDASTRFVKNDWMQPDLLFSCGNRGRWLLVEVQNSPDPEKQRRWLLASALLFNEKRAMGDVVVITANRHVANWASRIAQTSGPLGTQLGLAPLIVHLGPEAIERLLDPERPELGFFAAWAVRDQRGRKAERVVRKAIQLSERLQNGFRADLLRAIVDVLKEPLATYARNMIKGLDSIPEGPNWRALREELEARGTARGESEAVLKVLEARQVDVDTTTRAKVQSCTDHAQLDEWLRRAANATSAAEVFGTS